MSAQISDVKFHFNKKYHKSTQRFRILWEAVKHLFTGKQMMVYGNIYCQVGGDGSMSYSVWTKENCQSDWKHTQVEYDGKHSLKAYVDGLLTTASTKKATS